MEQLKEVYLSRSKECLFILDDDVSYPESFMVAVDFIEEKIQPLDFEYMPPFWDDGYGSFTKNGIKINISFTIWNGTELSVHALLTEKELNKVRNWALLIKEQIMNSKNQKRQ